jgi:cGMP-dependent protein kinase
LRENESQQQQQQSQRRRGSQSTNCVTRNDSINSNGTTTNTTTPTNNHALKYSNDTNMVVNNNKEQLRSSYMNNLKSKRIAISAESAQSRFNNVKNSKDTLKEHEKDEETEEFLKNAIFENDFLKNLEIDQIDNIVACMYPVDFDEGVLIISEGDIGNILYVVDEGIVEVTKNQRLVCTMSSGKLFGELAILYNCTRTASIRGSSFFSSFGPINQLIPF